MTKPSAGVAAAQLDYDRLSCFVADYTSGRAERFAEAADIAAKRHGLEWRFLEEDSLTVVWTDSTVGKSYYEAAAWHELGEP